MNTFDLIILIAMAFFVLSGLWYGVIHMVGGVAGIVVGTICAGLYYGKLGGMLLPMVGGNQDLANLLAFFGLFIFVNRLVGLLFYLIERIFSIVALIPFLKTFNRLLGAVFGLIEGTLVIGLLVYFAGRFSYSASFEAWMTGSLLARPFNAVGSILAPLLPHAVRALKSIF